MYKAVQLILIVNKLMLYLIVLQESSYIIRTERQGAKPRTTYRTNLKLFRNLI